MWVSIRDNCVGCGACAVISPEVFGMHGRKAAVNQDRVHWNEDNCIDAVKKAAAAIKQNFQEFLSGFFSIEIIVTILAIPAGIMFYLADERNIVFSDNAWLILIIYIAFVSSLYLYLQQMFAATLYLWIIKWKRAVRKAKLDKTPEPALQDIIPPSLLDNVPDLKYR